MTNQQKEPTDNYEKEYPTIAEGEFVYIEPLRYTIDGGPRIAQETGVGRVITKGSVTYVVYMFKERKIVNVSRPRMHVATVEEMLEI